MPSLSPNPSLPQPLVIALGVAALWLWQLGAEQIAVQLLGAPPGPVPGLLMLSAVTVLLQQLRPAWFARFAAPLEPAERFLLRQLPLLFSPALVAVLLRPLPGPLALTTLLVLLVVLALATVLVGGVLLRGLLHGASPLVLPAAAQPPPPVPPPSWRAIAALGLLTAGLAVALPLVAADLQHKVGLGLGVAVTVLGWWLGLRLPPAWARFAPPLVVVAVVGASVLSLAGMTADQYLSKSPLGGGRALLWLLGPAVQILALGLARRFAVVQQRTVAVVVPIVTLSALSLYLTPHLARWVGLPREWGLPLALRSVTSAVGLSLADGLPADPTRVAAAIVVTGVFVGQVGPGLLTRLRCHDPVARGVALGIAGHGLAAAELLRREPLAGVVASLVFALTAVATSLWLPWLAPLLWPLP